MLTSNDAYMLTPNVGPHLLESNGDLPPVELEQTYYRQHHTDLVEAG